jgi:hypothetical protein
LIGAATANIAVHVGHDLGSAGVFILGQQSGRLHDLTRLAVTALGHLFGHPSFLQFMGSRGRQAFNGCHLFARDLVHRHAAGSNRNIVHVHGASATLGHATTIFGAGELKVFPQNPQQRGGGCGIGHSRFAIDIERGGHARVLESLNRHGSRIHQRFPYRLRVSVLAQTDTFGSIEVKVQPSSSKWVQQCTLA